MSFWLAELAAELPFVVANIVIYSCITYWSIGFEADAGKVGVKLAGGGTAVMWVRRCMTHPPWTLTLTRPAPPRPAPQFFWYFLMLLLAVSTTMCFGAWGWAHMHWCCR